MTDKNDRGTPKDLFAELDAEFRFTLDVAATLANAKCERYYTKADDGLVQSWQGERVWCNPPYDVLHPWVEKAWSSNAELVAMLIPANRTEQPFWQNLIEPNRDGGGRYLLGSLPSVDVLFIPIPARWGKRLLV
jgi:phage N-6-adenine-methyltransferase